MTEGAAATPPASDVDQTTINTIRFLAVDMVQRANSGHPGAPMGQAALAYQLWAHHLRFDPAQPEWPNRDRFVLSCGHASALIYALLHLSGYDLPIEELHNFRQLHSRTPGHPEYGMTPGIETTTGPLGQGISNAVGMAIAESHLAARYNREGYDLFDHRVWVFASDGDLMEGVAAEASSLAGHLGLGKLNVFWDDNDITIDGSTELAFTEDVVKRYQAYGWHTLEVDDGNDLAAIEAAIQAAKAETGRPTLVRVKTHIGYGSPNKQDTSGAHGSPLGPDEVALTKKNLGWPPEPEFLVPEAAVSAFDDARRRGAEQSAGWNETLKSYREAHADAAAELDTRLAGELPAGWEDLLPTFQPEDGPLATRKASGAALTAVAGRVSELLGGSADLAPSNNTFLKGEAVCSAQAPDGRNFHFGVREHAMGAVQNGMALSKLLRPYSGTFLIFSDYMRPSIRLAALMELPSIFIFTHDSIFLGEDGPTHQPVSQLLSLRSIPGLLVLRPCDANETTEAWRAAILHREGPTALVLSRQKLPILQQTLERAREGVPRGAYVLADPPGEPQALLLASGSEVPLVLEAHRQLLADGVATRVVSMPCWSLFDAQDEAYRESVLPAGVTRRLAVEAGVGIGWHKYVGSDGDILSQEGFGASAPLKDLQANFRFTPEEVVRRVRAMV